MSISGRGRGNETLWNPERLYNLRLLITLSMLKSHTNSKVTLVWKVPVAIFTQPFLTCIRRCATRRWCLRSAGATCSRGSPSGGAPSTKALKEIVNYRLELLAWCLHCGGYLWLLFNSALEDWKWLCELAVGRPWRWRHSNTALINHAGLLGFISMRENLTWPYPRRWPRTWPPRRRSTARWSRRATPRSARRRGARTAGSTADPSPWPTQIWNCGREF